MSPIDNINNLPSDIFCWPMAQVPYRWKFLKNEKPEYGKEVILIRNVGKEYEKNICQLVESLDGDFWCIVGGNLSIQIPSNENDKWCYYL